MKGELAKLRVVNSRIPDKCKDATLVFKSFERLGLFVLSDKLIQNTGCDTLVDVTNTTKQKEILPDAVDGEPPQFFSDSEAYGGGPPVAESFAASYDEVPVASKASPPLAQGGPSLKVSTANRIAGESASRPVEIRKPKVDLRNFFPETWLFDLVELDVQGEKKLPLKAPHTITTWIAETICTDDKNGMQVSKPADLLVTQDFFADLYIPYSVKRGETFPLNVSVFNTIEEKLPMTVTLKKSPDFKVGRYEQSVCLNPEDNKIHTFAVKAKELNEVNITVEARISSDKNTGCNDNLGDAEGYADTLQKSIQVKPEGFPVEKVESEFVCRMQNDDETTLNMKPLLLPAPSELVNGSVRAWTTVTGDIMAPALSNLEKLLQQPTGCGEQVNRLKSY